MSEAGGRFTDFCFWLDRIARNNRLLNVPARWWRAYEIVAYSNVFLTCALLIVGVGTRFLFDVTNCTDGTSLAAPMCNMVVVFLLIVSLKQQQCGWTAMTTSVFMLVVLSNRKLNIPFVCDLFHLSVYALLISDLLSWRRPAESSHPRRLY
ncbi:hypothetical protein M3Y99_00032300 [Aphelenchoides fujianensis]|nr:hypothetical protein M3Y99_00032300 [Aphelenchoides fujianensis]